MSATCEQVQEKMAAFVDDEIATSEGEQILAHLAQCPACMRVRAGQEQVKEILRTRMPSVPAPFALRARIRRDVPGGGGFSAALRKIFEFYPSRAWAIVAAAALIIAAATIWSQRLWAGLADPMAYQSEAMIVGKIICADCTLMQKTQTATVHLPAHHLVIQTQDGKIWTIVLSPAGEQLLQSSGAAARRVQARGYTFPHARYIQVTDFTIMQN